MPLTAQVPKVRRSANPGRTQLHAALVTLWVVLQAVAVSDQFPVLNAPLLWALMPICIGGLATSAAHAFAQKRQAAGARQAGGDALRAWMPLYVVTILATAFVLGPLVTTESRLTYLTDPQTYLYLLNLVAFPQYSLIGVFQFNSLSDVVNQNVWIAPCVVLTGLAVAVPQRRRFAPALPLILAIALAVAALIVPELDVDLGDPRAVGAFFLRGDGLSGLFGGLLGVAMFRGRRRLPLDGRIAIGALIVVALVALAGNGTWRDFAAVRLLIAVPVGYAAVTATQKRWVGSALAARLAPYVPGLLLFSFPLQQTVVQFGPSQQSFVLNLALGGGGALLLSMAFWKGIGRRLITRQERTAIATAATARPLWTPRRRKRDEPVLARALAMWLLGGIVFAAVTLGMVAMLYLAFQPDRGGI